MLLRVNPALTVEAITDTAALEALYPEWSELWVRSPAATPFQAPHWLIPWWKHLGHGELWTLALRCQRRLRGVVPLFIYSDLGKRKVLLLGIGISDCLDALVDAEFEASAGVAIAEHLQSHSRRWDSCEFQQLRAGSVLLKLPSLTEYSDNRCEQVACPVLALTQGWQSIPRHQRDNMRYYQRRVQRLGTVEIERADSSNWEELFEALLRLHNARWATRGLTGVLAEPMIQRFHTEAIPGLLSLGVLRLYGLRLKGEIVASFYGFTAKQRAYYYLSGFAPEWQPLSLGTLIVGHAIQEAVREQVTEFDFLRGRETYKYLWGARDRLNYLRQIQRSA